MDMFSYRMDVRHARIDLDIAKRINDELAAGVPLPSLGFEPRGRSGGISDRTAIEAMRRIRRRESATRKAKDAIRVLDEFREILEGTLNHDAVRALWFRWAMGMRYPDIAKRLDMPVHIAVSLIRDAEDAIRPAIEKL